MSENGKVETFITLLMRVSEKPCSKCQYDEHGRVFRILAIQNISHLIDWELVPVDYKVFKKFKKTVVGKDICLDCLF